MSGRLRASMEPDRFLTCAVCCTSPSPTYQRVASELEIGHDQKAHRIYGKLAFRLQSGGDLARMSDEEILTLKDIGPATLKRIRTRIPAPARAQYAQGPTSSELAQAARSASAAGVLQLAACHIEATYGDQHYELSRAVTLLLLEAAEDYARCERVNARARPGALAELPNPVSEAAHTAALILMEMP